MCLRVVERPSVVGSWSVVRWPRPRDLDEVRGHWVTIAHDSSRSFQLLGDGVHFRELTRRHILEGVIAAFHANVALIGDISSSDYASALTSRTATKRKPREKSNACPTASPALKDVRKAWCMPTLDGVASVERNLHQDCPSCELERRLLDLVVAS